MKIDKGFIHDVMGDICIVVNKNVKYKSKEHIAIHYIIKKSTNKIYQHLKI